jgi:hypothetical protein
MLAPAWRPARIQFKQEKSMRFQSRITLAASFAALLPLSVLAGAPAVNASAPVAQAVPPAAAAPTAADSAAQAVLQAPRHVAPAEVWTVKRGSELRDVLYDWSKQAGWTLVWESEYSYLLQADAAFNGDFVAALSQLFDALRDVNPPLFPEVFKGNRVVLVKNQPTK